MAICEMRLAHCLRANLKTENQGLESEYISIGPMLKKIMDLLFGPAQSKNHSVGSFCLRQCQSGRVD